MKIFRSRYILALFVLCIIAVFYFFSHTDSTSSHISPVSDSASLLRSAESRPHPDGTYNVIRVIDGDTVIVDDNGKPETIRILGMNTPETVDPRKPVQCFGKEASNQAKAVLNGTYVTLESDPSQDATDKYGRTLAYVILADGTNFELSMIQEGYAFEYTYDRPYKYQKDFRAAQAEAKSEQLGLWSPSTCDGELKSAN